MSAETPLPDSAETVIVGAGCVGCSAAYHLAERGRDGVVVVDQGPLFETGGRPLTPRGSSSRRPRTN